MDQSKAIKKELIESIDKQKDINMENVKNRIEILENKPKRTRKKRDKDKEKESVPSEKPLPKQNNEKKK